jgi:hypothetical protein
VCKKGGICAVTETALAALAEWACMLTGQARLADLLATRGGLFTYSRNLAPLLLLRNNSILALVGTHLLHFIPFFNGFSHYYEKNPNTFLRYGIFEKWARSAKL